MAQSFRKPVRFPTMAEIQGLQMAAGVARVKYEGRKDLMLAVFEKPAGVAGVFTKSRAASAAVRWDRKVVRGGVARALVVNSGNANAFTGLAGERAVQQTVEATARALNCPAEQVLVSSTGVIGEELKVSRIVNAIPKLSGRLKRHSWRPIADAIMTTDTFPKGASSVAMVNGREVRITGVAKGSGMIAPNMATMLAYIFTDARLPVGFLKKMVRRATDLSFNCITVDGDTSTSDTVLLFATGAVPLGFSPQSIADRRVLPLRSALDEVMTDLAQQIVCDGEGATKFITINVTGASSIQGARRVGMSVANSPLVKTAMAGSDPNWGRIVMAIGNSGEKIRPESLRLHIGPFLVTCSGSVSDGYKEGPVANYMLGEEIEIGIELGMGRAKATVWTCDLSHGYVSINADYRS